MGIPLTLPTPNDPATNGTWGTTYNTALNAINGSILAASKTADQAYNTTTLTNDTHLLLPVVASATYAVDWWLRIDGPAANDFKYSWTAPAGAAFVWSSLGALITNTVNDPAAFPDVVRHTDGPLVGTVIQHGTIAASTFQTIRGQGLLTVAGTAGN